MILAANPKPQLKRLVILFIKPSKYDDDGYLVQFRKGVLPSNSIFTMNSVTRAALQHPDFRELNYQIIVKDESVWAQNVEVEAFMAEHQNLETKVVVGLVAVQTNQFPRATDLARAFKNAGAIVVVGGFHVSGSITMLYDGKDGYPCPHVMPPEIQALIDEDIVIFHGEAEDVWKDTLYDICFGTPKLLYRGGRPDIRTAPMPEHPIGYFRDFVTTMDTVDLNRGCPFTCDFCSIITVSGNKSRARDPALFVNHIRMLARKEPNPFMFIVDDNFARNLEWREVLSGLAKLRREGINFRFMTEVDLACWKLPGFIEALAKAGCIEVFMGVESVNQRTLNDADKRQNHPSEYPKIFAKFHAEGITVHAGYIIGFPNDTPESIREDVETLQRMGVDIASFFILTDIPGSIVHLRDYLAGVPMDPDLNNYDSFHPTSPHPRMTKGELFKAFQVAWTQFYTKHQMVEVLKRTLPQEYFGTFRKLLWYVWSAVAEKTHPMIAGAYRIRNFKNRRPSALAISYARHALNEVKRHLYYLGWFLRIMYLFQGVYFETRWLPKLAKRYKDLGDWREAFTKHQATIQEFGRIWNERFAKSHWFSRTFGRAAHRKWLDDFWKAYASRKWRLLLPYEWPWHVRAVPHAVTDVVYFVRFLSALVLVAVKGNS